MISIKKPPTPPKILQNRGKAETDDLCVNYQKNIQSYKTGANKFSFKRDIYGNNTVKASLKSAQHHKCFLCESRISHISYGDVEHYRPKGGIRQSEASSMLTPGYYWLAYNWENLFLACQLCNQRFKKNLFPLTNPTRRATSHTHHLRKENPLFINPSTENPENHISFRGTVPYAINGSLKGDITITYAGLKRTELIENRQELYDKVKALYNLAIGCPKTPYQKQAMKILKKELQKCQSIKHQYSAMFRAAVKDNFCY